MSGPGVAHHGVRSGGAAGPDGLPAADPGAEDTTRGVREQSEAAADSSGSSSCGRRRSADACRRRREDSSALDLSAW